MSLAKAAVSLAVAASTAMAPATAAPPPFASPRMTSTPNVQQYNPRAVAWQFEAIKDIRRNFDYGLGTHEILFTGSVGSGKSLPMAHIIVTHCLMYPGANFGVGRKSLPKLKATLIKKIREHLANTGIEYTYNKQSGDIAFANGSAITAFSWSDGNFEKFGSYELSGMAFEELTETRESTAYQFAYTRVGRLPHVPENIVISATNPDAPSHWAYQRFFVEKMPTRHVYFSLTDANKFLSKSYIEGVKANIDPKRARRMVYGEWIELNNERVYHAYDSDKNFKRDEDYKISLRHPIRLAWDFNIAKGKPLSMIAFQYIDGVFHFFDEVIIEGMRTEGSCEEAAERGLLEHPVVFVIHGDASGKHGDTRSIRSDYDIIKNFFSKYKTKDNRSLNFRVEVPLANPPVRKRHNVVNAYCENEQKQVRLFVYKKCKTIDEGMRLTQLKDNAQYIEDDSKHFQHCTTALGYGILSTISNESRQAPGMIDR